MNMHVIVKINCFVLLCLFLFLPAFAPRQAGAAVMNDYCVAPIGISSSMPNLLLMIDNSGSMYDLQYTDTATKYCPNNPNTVCTGSEICSGAAQCVASATTTESTAHTPKPCTSLADCTSGHGGESCDSGFCKWTFVDTTTVTITPISCTQDSQCTVAPNDTCNNKCGISRSCYDDGYDNVQSYSGLFRQDALYQFMSALTAPLTAAGNKDEFIAMTTAMPTTCTYGGAGSAAPFVCVDLAASGPDIGKVSNFIATGNFLNWLTTSKFDIEKQILTGGKFLNNDSAALRNLVGESRGCAGRKFIKALPAMPGLTFALRGGTAEGIDELTNEATESGLTYIQIYQGTYNTAACTAAMSDWMNINSTNLGTLQGDSKCCLAGGTSTSGCNPTDVQVVAANQTIHDCYWYFTGHALSNLNVLEGNCVDVWNVVSAATITDPSAGGAVCSSVLPHANSTAWSSSLYPGYNTGYLGLCYNFATGVWDDACALNENKDFCQAMGGSSAVTDPPSDLSIPGTLQGIPGFVMESGLSSMTLLNSYTSSGVTPAGAARGVLSGFRVYIYDPGNTPWPPVGLVNKYKSLVRFGIMTFQNDGASSECGTGSFSCKKYCNTLRTRQCFSNSDCPSNDCVAIPKTDGGLFVAAVGAAPGSHASGLIRTIDNISATSWTPYGEAFYNAMGYFARTNAYPVSPATTPVGTSRNFNFPTTVSSRSYVATIANPSQYKCQKNNILLLTDGMSTADRNPTSEGLAALYASQVPGIYSGVSGSCPSYKGSSSINVLAWLAKNRNIKTFSTSEVSTDLPSLPSDYINTYVVYTGPSAGANPNLCDPYTLMDNTAMNGGTAGLLMASDPDSLYDSLENALLQISAGAVSGTAASVLASGEGSGANLIQAVFYPKKKFINGNINNGVFNEIAWTGRLTNLWYYVDPYFSQSSLREDDGVLIDGAKVLDLQTSDTKKDYIVNMYYDQTAETAKVSRWPDTNGDGAADGSALTPDIIIDNISDLWEAGTLLWQRDVTVAAGKRKIYTSIDGTSLLTGNFSRNAINPVDSGGTVDADNSAALAPYLQAASASEAANLIDWVQGIDGKKGCSNSVGTACTTNANCVAPGTCIVLYRNRSVKVDLDGDGSTLSAGETVLRPWKLGDILNSTPKISSWMPLNAYNKTNGDGTYGVPNQDSLLGSAPDSSHFTTTSAYKDRGMVFVGGNDGMLHAIKLGKLELKWDGQNKTEISRLTGTSHGKEMWAFIPKNALPYLRYMAAAAYCHVYSVDLTPYIFDASVGGSAGDQSAETRTAESWRTVLIGGMRYGGACMKNAASCSDVDGDGVKDCVNTPKADPADATKGLGYSSYFALDVTDQNNPKLLWEFANENLGFSTAGPVVLRMNARDGADALPNANGKWFVVLASGPTGPIDTGSHQFMGRSDQRLNLFVLDLKSGTLLRTIDTGIDNAFAGNMVGSALDTDIDYQDDVVYVPYTAINSSVTPTPTWTKGGVGRLLTSEDPDTSVWSFSRVTTGDFGPVTASVSKLLDTNSGKLWLFFGTGREYYKNPASPDDPDGQRYLIGVKDPCYTGAGFQTTCAAPVSLGNLTDVTTTQISTPPDKGWYIALVPAGDYTHPPEANRAYNAQRSITDSSASTRGLVYFTTYKPYDDECALTGRTSLWAVKYDTGGAAAGLLTGTIVIQLSTGQIAQVNIATAFTDPAGNPVREVMMDSPGRPPGPGGGLIAPRSAVNKTLHIKEK